MHNNPKENPICKGNSYKRSANLQRREVIFEPRKRAKSSSPGSSSQPSILTSSRPNSEHQTAPKEPAKGFTPLSADQFYAAPKSFLEKQYEKHLKIYVPTGTSDDFVPLESEPESLWHDAESSSRSLLDTSKSIGEELDRAPADHEAVPLQLRNLMTKSNESTDMQIAILLNASEAFLSKARSLVLECNDTSGTASYYSYVKLAMKALHMILENYKASLSPLLETAINQNLAVIYLEETDSLDRAETFTVSAITMASRHGLTKLKIMSELLYSQILERNQAGSISTYYSERQKSYTELEYKPIADLFNWIRIENMLVHDVVSGARALRMTNLRDNVNPTLRFLFLMREATFNQYRDVAYTPTPLTTQAQELLKRIHHPPQLQASLDIFLLASCAIKNDVTKGNSIIRKISHFIHKQRKVNWTGWEQDGSILIQLPLSDNLPDKITVKLNWVNHYEFSILFYFFSGVLSVVSSETYRETKRIFGKCLNMIDSQLSDLTSTSNPRSFSVQYLTRNIVRLTFIRYSVIFYSVYMEMMHRNDLSGFASVQNFISCFDKDSFTPEEMCYYKLLIPKFLYLAALAYHSKGDLFAAKYYYYRVRNLTSSTPEEQDHYSSALQKQISLGWDTASPIKSSNELFLYATVHLLGLVKRQMAAFYEMQHIDIAEARSVELINSANALSDDLEKALNDNQEILHNRGPLQSLDLCYQLICSPMFARSNDGSGSSKPNLQILNEQYEVEGYIKALTTYVKYKISTNQKQRAQMLMELAKIGSTDDDNTRLVALLVLSEEMIREISNGNTSRASKIEARINRLRKNLESKMALVEYSLNT